MGKLKSQTNNTFCVLNAQSVCAFARVNCAEYAQILPQTFENIAQTTLSTLLVGVKHLSALAFSLWSGEGGDAMCQ